MDYKESIFWWCSWLLSLPKHHDKTQTLACHSLAIQNRLKAQVRLQLTETAWGPLRRCFCPLVYFEAQSLKLL